MSLFKTFDKKIELTRRDLLKGMGAVATSGAIAGCSTGDGQKSYFDEAPLGNFPPAIPATEIKYGATPHNCGGGCLSKYYTQNGVVKRIVTDEDRFDGEVLKGKAQFRSCLRCRSRKEWFYRTDRLTVPLSRFDESGNEIAARGDIKNYVKRSWDSVINEITEKQKVALARTNHDPRTVMCTYGLGDRTMQNYYMKHGVTATALNGATSFQQDLSYPQWIYTYQMIDFEMPFRSDSGEMVSLRAVYREGNSRADVMNSSHVIIWSANPAETRLGVNSTLFLNEAMKAGKDMTVIDARYTMTAEVYGKRFIAPQAGTDAALVLGMLHYLITETWNPDGTLSATPKLNPAHIKRYIHGFFDDNPATLTETIDERFYQDNAKAKSVGGPITMMGQPIMDWDKTLANPMAYVVPEGASLSAYILGATDDRLAKDTTETLNIDGTKGTAGKLNFGTSIYPETIGYNVNENDPLYNKVAPCYGKIAKTPEWASKITGVPVETIKLLADIYSNKNNKVTTYHGAGVQRHSEGEQFCWLLPILCTATSQFGEEGRSYGFIMELTAKGPGMEYGAETPMDMKKIATAESALALQKSAAELFKGAADGAFSSLTDPFAFGSLMTRDAYPVFTWADLFNNAGTGKSDWNVGKIKNTTVKPSVVWNICGGPVTQSANAAYAKEALNNIETVISCDIFMTPSVECSDYILPAAAVGEKWGMTDGYLTSDSIIMQPVSNPPSEAKNEFEIGRLLAKAAGKEEEYCTVREPLDNPDGTKSRKITNDYELANWRFDLFLKNNPDMIKKGWTWEKFQKRGYLSCLEENVGANIAAYNNRPLAKLVAREMFKMGAINPETGKWAPYVPLLTPTGKVEAYCQQMTEEHEAGFNDIYDKRTNQADALRGAIYSFSTFEKLGTGDLMAPATRRFVYPIPMYIPSIEGRHACDDDSGTSNDETLPKHPDLLGYGSQFPCRVQSFHFNYRAHSVLNNVGYLNELYKRDANGEPAFMKDGRAITDGAWEDGIYEPVYINPETAQRFGIADGDRVKISNGLGARYPHLTDGVVFASAHVTNRIAPYSLGIGDASWYTLNQDGVDISGCCNTLYHGRPARIGFGMSLGSDARVKIERA